MKQLCIICFLFCFIRIETYMAQGLEIRPQTGISVMKINPSPVETNLQATLSFMIGGDVFIGKRFFGMTGLQYQRFRVKIDYSEQNGAEQLVSGNLMRIPINGGMRLLRKSSKTILNARVYGGFMFYYLGSVKTLTATNVSNQLRSDDFNPAYLSSNIGGGVDFLRFFCDVQFEKGVSNIFRFTDYYGKSKVDGMSIIAGMRFRF
jgi:hypothetical protein